MTTKNTFQSNWKNLALSSWLGHIDVALVVFPFTFTFAPGACKASLRIWSFWDMWSKNYSKKENYLRAKWAVFFFPVKSTVDRRLNLLEGEEAASLCVRTVGLALLGTLNRSGDLVLQLVSGILAFTREACRMSNVACRRACDEVSIIIDLFLSRPREYSIGSVKSAILWGAKAVFPTLQWISCVAPRLEVGIVLCLKLFTMLPWSEFRSGWVTTVVVVSNAPIRVGVWRGGRPGLEDCRSVNKK